MCHFADLETVTMVAAGPEVRAIGWLDRGHAYPTGDAPGAFLQRVESFAAQWDDSTRLLGLNIFLGSHGCGFCNDASGFGNFGVPSGDIIFVAPELVAHYVRCHRYLPPAEFVAAVMAAPLPRTAEYRALVEPFIGRLELSPEDGRVVGEPDRDVDAPGGRRSRRSAPSCSELRW